MKCVQIRSFFWPVFSRIWTEYGEIRSISPYSVRMRENMDQKKLRIWTALEGSDDTIITNSDVDINDLDKLKTDVMSFIMFSYIY